MRMCLPVRTSSRLTEVFTDRGDVPQRSQRTHPSSRPLPPHRLTHTLRFLVAGHETTSSGTALCLFALAQAPEVQVKLREELWSVQTENPTMDELNALPYLDAVVRETMRLHAPVPSSIRIAMRDDVIPLNTPYVDVHGQVHDVVPVTKGSPIFIPILAINRAKVLWGEDAHEFR